MVVRRTAVVHAVVQIMQINGIEGVHVSWERKITVTGKYGFTYYQFTIERRDRHVIVIGAHFKSVRRSGDLATSLSNTDGHVVGAFSRRGPGGVPVAICRIVGIVGLQG